MPDGRIAAVSGDVGVFLWEPRETDANPAFINDEVDNEEEMALAVTPDGRIVTGSRRGEVRVRPIPPRERNG